MGLAKRKEAYGAHGAHVVWGDPFKGTIKQFVELVNSKQQFMSARGRWIIGQMLYVESHGPGKVVIKNTPY
jgi:hypothetical protein